MYAKTTFRFFLSLATSLMAACNSQEPQVQPASSSMIFSVELGSRANVISNDNITAYPFVVYSDMISLDRIAESSFIKVHDATKVRYDSSDNQWTYDNIKYWFPGFQYSFVAIHPADNRCLSEIAYSNNRLKFIYKQPTQYKDASDLLISAHRRDYTGGKTDAVHFKFAHILSNIGIDVKYIDPNEDALPLMITGITFKNIPTEADYVITPAPLAGSSMTDDYNGGWTITERDDVKIEFSGNGIGVEPNAEIGHHVFSDSNALLLLPNPDAPTEMILSYTTYEESVAVNRTASVTVPRWNQGLNYTLLLTIFNNRVRFSIEVTDWEETKPIDTTVPRS